MKLSTTIEFEEFGDFTELAEQDRLLLSKANEFRDKAYAPYSNFLVGAAVLLSNGQIIAANNQENAAYPSGLCAERVAVFSAMANYPSEDIVAIAVSASGLKSEPVPPCGACRQVILEYETRSKRAIKVIFGHPDSKIRIINSIALLLPFSFDFSHLPERK